METVVIRLAREPDLAAINGIYNHYVLTSTCTWQLEPETEEGRRQWYAAHSESHPVIVAERGGEVVGWGSVSAFHARRGYRFTVEDSVYVRHDAQRQGIGAALLADLVARARAQGYHAMIGAISGDQPGSIALHRRFGFETVGRLPEVGWKFDRWLDVVYMQRRL